jgi:hypothetical protein
MGQKIARGQRAQVRASGDSHDRLLRCHVENPANDRQILFPVIPRHGGDYPIWLLVIAYLVFVPHRILVEVIAKAGGKSQGPLVVELS